VTIAALAALAQSTRLDTFRLLVSREPDGVPAGELACIPFCSPAVKNGEMIAATRTLGVSGNSHGPLN
jgi:ArsR family transcriptional regulator